MPAEWAPHEATWLQWPHEATLPGYQRLLEPVWLEMTRALHRHELVQIAVIDERHGEQLERQLAFYGFDLRRVGIHVIPTDDIWARDNGPVFVVNADRELAVTDWNFNGWGERFPFARDRAVPGRIAALLSLPRHAAPIVLEGGALEVNGRGTLMATRSSIVNANRNPGLDDATIEAALRDTLGIRHVIWLSGAPLDYCEAYGDVTDYHVDGTARFVDETTVLYSWTDEDPDVYLRRHRDELREAVTESGKPLTLVPLPMTKHRLHATARQRYRPPFDAEVTDGVYANYYVANGVVLVPVYGDPNDAPALSIIAEHFPDREIVGIDCRLLAQYGGMIHCVTQQQPAV